MRPANLGISALLAAFLSSHPAVAESIAGDNPSQVGAPAAVKNATQQKSTPSSKSPSVDGQVAGKDLDLPSVVALLRRQQQEMARQGDLLKEQAQQIKSLQQEIDVLRAPTLTGVKPETAGAAKARETDMAVTQTVVQKEIVSEEHAPTP